MGLKQSVEYYKKRYGWTEEQAWHWLGVSDRIKAKQIRSDVAKAGTKPLKHRIGKILYIPDGRGGWIESQC